MSERRQKRSCSTCRFWVQDKWADENEAGDCHLIHGPYITRADYWCASYQLERRDPQSPGVRQKAPITRPTDSKYPWPL